MAENLPTTLQIIRFWKTASRLLVAAVKVHKHNFLGLQTTTILCAAQSRSLANH